MAADYLEVQKQLEDMRTYKKELEENLRQSEIQMEDLASKTENGEAKKFVQLQKEKVISNLSYFNGVFFNVWLIFRIFSSWLEVDSKTDYFETIFCDLQK